MLIRSMFSTIATAGLTLAMVPLGCGGAQEEYPYVPQSQQESSSATNEWVMPEAVVEQLRGCVKEHASDLRTYSHETKFDLTVNNDGAVEGIKLRSSTLHHEAIESCLSGALAGLSIPPSMFPVRASSVPFSGGESSRHSREPLGIVQALGGMVALGPIVLIAAGVTLGVFVAVAVTEETIEAVKRNRKLDKMCQERLVECLATTPGICYECHGFCLAQGRWNELACPRYRPN